MRSHAETVARGANYLLSAIFQNVALDSGSVFGVTQHMLKTGGKTERAPDDAGGADQKNSLLLIGAACVIRGSFCFAACYCFVPMQ